MASFANGAGGALGEYLERKREDPMYRRFVPGQLVWVRQVGPVFRPAKVKKAFDEGSENEGLVMYKQNGKIETVPVSLAMQPVHYMGKENLQAHPNFSPEKLIDFSEPALFHNIRMRFELDYRFMTICDEVLVFLNADFETDVPSLSSVSDWGDGDMKEMVAQDPQICQESFNTVVERAFGKLVSSGGKSSQSIVISGVAESGKRDITRYVLLKSIQLSRPKNGDWWQRLLAGDSLLEAFGGNQGYFRWTELQLFFPAKSKQPELLGAVCNAFGLDQSRVTDCDQPLFPVFDCLARGGGMGSARGSESFTYMKRSSVNGGSSKRSWGEIREAFRTLGLDEQGCDDLESILVGILETGNIQFANAYEGLEEEEGKARKKKDNGNKKKAEIDEEEARAKELEMERAMGDADKIVLGVRLGELRNALKTKTLRVKHETFEKERNIREKYAGRDGLARVLYTFLFDWLIAMINTAVSRIEDTVNQLSKTDQGAASSGKHKSMNVASRISKRLSQMRGGNKGTIGIIGVLENSALDPKVSSLEELYQNYRLERLHAFFAHHLERQNARRVSEVCDVSAPIQPPASSTKSDLVLNLFMGSAQASYSLNYAPNGEKRGLGGKKGGGVAARYQPSASGGASAPAGSGGSPLGILQLVEEETFLPAGSDKALAGKISRKQKYNETLSKTSALDFTVAHYGAPVEYSIDGFVDRSRANIVPAQVLQLLKEKSSIALLREVAAFRRDPIGQSGVMAKRELESMLELNNKAMEAAAAAADANGPEDERMSVAERSEVAKRIFNEMNQACTILGRTEVQYVVALSANRETDPDAALDAQFLLDQIRELGISDAISKRLGNTLRPSGKRDAHNFVCRYAPLDPATKDPQKGSASVQKSTVTCLLQNLAKAGLLQGQWELSNKGDTVVINAESFFSLESALLLLQAQK